MISAIEHSLYISTNISFSTPNVSKIEKTGENKEQPNEYCLLHVISVNKSVRMRWVKHVVQVGEFFFLQSFGLKPCTEDSIGNTIP
jgi:hypothetical protein